MAKKQKEPTRRGLLDAAKAAHQFEVGAGGNIYQDPLMSGVRGIELPSLALMELLGFTAMRDSCSILIDGAPGSSKSSLALEFYNWIRIYGGTGCYVDAENKAAVDIAYGMLDDVHLWHPANRVDFITCASIEEAQKQIITAVRQCGKANEKQERDYQIPIIAVIDPMSGLLSEEHTKHVDEEKSTDRGHGGRDEALLWSKWIKYVNLQIINLPFILVVVNHEKVKTEQHGARTIERSYNPGGIAQNYQVTIGLRCRASQKQQIASSIEGDTYQNIWIECTKNSRGPTGKSICVRKYAKRREDGSTVFWWDWPWATATMLANYGARDPIREICSVTKASETKFSCKELGLKDEEPTVVGQTIHKNKELVENLIKYYRWRRIKTFQPITDEDYKQLMEEAQKNMKKRLEELREEENA